MKQHEGRDPPPPCSGPSHGRPFDLTAEATRGDRFGSRWPSECSNVGAYTVDGGEVSLQIEPTERLALFVGGTLSGADPETVPNLPRTTAVGGLTWSGNVGWRLNVDLQWVDDRYVLNPRYAAGPAAVDGYLLANARFDLPWRWLGLELDGSVFAVGENLFDDDYEHRLGYPMPGRMVQLGIAVGF